MPNPPLLLHTSIDSRQSNNPILKRGRCFEADCPTPSSLPTATKGPPPSSLSFSPPLCTALPKPSQLPPPKDRCFYVPIHHGSLTSGEDSEGSRRNRRRQWLLRRPPHRLSLHRRSNPRPREGTSLPVVVFVQQSPKARYPFQPFPNYLSDFY
ncbi:cinnamoyl-CoA reductase 1-like [Pyrus ussuriensis x Pyrus communis]|uniref:Cinnamoyl-CoA reductase 1-like n=1 Tax=Pyrus ussuriensis x Pyrus communis TaxID=2448454 RepID=A0A5N5I1C3_9ROSA|nr:cinnamoyl-CoA reductase 1-like [Pyrus ussuriensis x Pyrus communis]